MDRLFDLLTEGSETISQTLKVQGRSLDAHTTARGVARFDFEELCARPLGSADYLALTETFHTLLVANVPRLGPENRNEAKRFVTLVDILYEAGSNLILSAEVEAEHLYEQGDGHFEFSRTVSRLMEMRSEAYLKGVIG